MKLLLDSHAEPNHTDDETNTALHCAASSLRCAPLHTLCFFWPAENMCVPVCGSVKIMEVLLNATDIAINATNASGNSPLLVVCGGGFQSYEREGPETTALRLSAAKMLLSAGADPRQVRAYDLASPLVVAVCRGPHAHALVLTLLEEGAPPCRESAVVGMGSGASVFEEPLALCVKHGDIETALSLCRALARSSPGPRGHGEFKLADGFALALARGVSDSFAMAEAIARCAVDAFSADVMAQLAMEVPPLHACARVGAVSILELLAEAQGGTLGVDAYDGYPRFFLGEHQPGRTALHHAVMHGQVESARWRELAGSNPSPLLQSHLQPSARRLPRQLSSTGRQSTRKLR